MSIVNVIFENNDFIACDKPAGVLSVPDRHKSDRPCLGLELQKQKGIQIFPVHRLDLEVSGLILFAKNSRGHRASQDWFAKKLLQKKYKALTLKQDFSHWPENVKAARDRLDLKPGSEFLWKMNILRGKRRSFESPHGDPSETKAIYVGEREEFLEWDMYPITGRSARDRLDLKPGSEFLWKMNILRGKRRSFESPHGDPSETKAIYVGEREEFLEWDMYPITGRSHQLRLELSRHGFSIAGDELYGSKTLLKASQWPFGSLALRAIEITFNEQICSDFDFPFVLSTTYL